MILQVITVTAEHIALAPVIPQRLPNSPGHNCRLERRQRGRGSGWYCILCANRGPRDRGSTLPGSFDPRPRSRHLHSPRTIAVRR